MQSETIGKLAEALSKAQSEMERAKKDSINPHFKNKYADIASIIDAIREPLSKYGLSFVQYAHEESDKIFLVTRLMHSSGEWIEGKLKLFINKPDMQGLGGAITYARRYCLSAMVGIAQDDDDGEAAGKSQPQPDDGETTGKSQPQPQFRPFKPENKMNPDQIKEILELVTLNGKNEYWLNAQVQKNFSKPSFHQLSLEEYQKTVELLKKMVQSKTIV